VTTEPLRFLVYRTLPLRRLLWELLVGHPALPGGAAIV
jgi:hypothetical protein